jgi:uridine phosphorylase
MIGNQPLQVVDRGASGTAVRVVAAGGGGAAAVVCVRKVMYVVTTVGDGPLTLKTVVRVRVSIGLSGIPPGTPVLAGLSSSGGTHCEYHSFPFLQKVPVGQAKGPA